MPGGSSQELTGELICYGRSVVGTEWDAVAEGRLQDSINPWGAAHVQDRRGAASRRPTASSPPTTSGCSRASDRSGGPQRARAHGGRHHPDAAVAGALPDLRRHLRLHALLRRQQRGSGDPVGARRQRRRRHHRADAAARLLRPPARRGARWAEAGRDGALAAHRRRPGSTPSACRSTRPATPRATPAEPLASGRLARRRARRRRGRSGPGEEDDHAQQQHPGREDELAPPVLPRRDQQHSATA